MGVPQTFPWAHVRCLHVASLDIEYYSAMQNAQHNISQ